MEVRRVLPALQAPYCLGFARAGGVRVLCGFSAGVGRVQDESNCNNPDNPDGRCCNPNDTRHATPMDAAYSRGADCMALRVCRLLSVSQTTMLRERCCPTVACVCA